MKVKLRFLVRALLILGVLFGLTGGLKNTVHAETCTWTGNVNTSWDNSGNWTCGHVPESSDDVVIPTGLANYPKITNYPTKYIAYANNLTIQAGATLLVTGRLELLANNVDNYGTIKTEGTESTYMRGGATINNYGTIDADGGTISIHEGGFHTGTFKGQNGLIGIAGQSYYYHTFSSTSSILVKEISFYYNKSIDIQGTFSQIWPDSSVSIEHSDVMISNLTNLQIGSVELRPGGSLTIGISGTTSGSVSVPAGSSLVGTGTVSGDLTNAGTVSPGASPGTIAVAGNYTQDATGVLKIELGGTTADTEYDQLTVTGEAALAGTLQVNLIDPFAPTEGDIFTIMTYGSRTETFTTENLPALGTGLEWQINYGDTAVALAVVPAGGTITGTVTYTGTKGFNTVTVGLFTNPDDPPFKTVDVDSSDGTYPYILSGLPNGTYFVGALMDLNEDDQPDSNEPLAWYDHDGNEEPDQIVISSESGSHTGVDFDLSDPGSIQGTVTYTGFLGISGPISVSAHLSLESDPSATAADIQSGAIYTIEGLLPGSYYISAYLDADESGGPPDEGEPLAWYDIDSDGVPDLVVISAETPEKTEIDIVLGDKLLNIYLPIISR